MQTGFQVMLLRAIGFPGVNWVDLNFQLQKRLCLGPCLGLVELSWVPLRKTSWFTLKRGGLYRHTAYISVGGGG